MVSASTDSTIPVGAFTVPAVAALIVEPVRHLVMPARVAQQTPAPVDPRSQTAAPITADYCVFHSKIVTPSSPGRA